MADSDSLAIFSSSNNYTLWVTSGFEGSQQSLTVQRTPLQHWLTVLSDHFSHQWLPGGLMGYHVVTPLQQSAKSGELFRFFLPVLSGSWCRGPAAILQTSLPSCVPANEDRIRLNFAKQTQAFSMFSWLFRGTVTSCKHNTYNKLAYNHTKQMKVLPIRWRCIHTARPIRWVIRLISVNLVANAGLAGMMSVQRFES